MELAKELLIVLGRIVTILPLLLLITLYMGKRSIGELPVFDFLVIISLGAVAGADIADPKINHIHTAVAIIAIGLFQRIVSNWMIKSRKFGRLITFEPTIVIKDGIFLTKNLKSIRYSVDNVLQMLREKDIFDVSDVEMGIIEANGKITVHKRASKENIKVEDIGISKSTSGMAFPVIIEGKIYSEVLRDLNLTEKWLKQELANRGVLSMDTIFFASINQKKELHVSLINQEVSKTPPVIH